MDLAQMPKPQDTVLSQGDHLNRIKLFRKRNHLKDRKEPPDYQTQFILEQNPANGNSVNKKQQQVIYPSVIRRGVIKPDYVYASDNQNGVVYESSKRDTLDYIPASGLDEEADDAYLRFCYETEATSPPPTVIPISRRDQSLDRDRNIGIQAGSTCTG